jgi:hypothetical protein
VIRSEHAALRKRPFYVMACGARGIKTSSATTDDPGFFTDGRRICETNVNAFQRFWFALQAARNGFAGVVAWDFSAYDRKGLKHYSLVGAPTEKPP